MFSWLKRKKGILASAVLIAVMLSLLGVRIVDRDSPDLGQVQFGVGNEKVITLGYEALAAGSLDYTFDGVDDDVQLQAALDALPATGGRLVIVSAVQINLSNTVSRAIDNVIIEGAGDGTYFVNDGVTAIFDAGVQDGWRFSNFRTDAGGLDVATATNYRIDNVTIGTTFYPASTKTATFVVAASDSTTQSKAQADYVCDGTDDQVEIQAAIDALPAGGGKIFLTEGVFIKGNVAGITVPSNVTIQMAEGTKITFITNVGNDAVIFTNSDADDGNSNIEILGGVLDGNKANQPKIWKANEQTGIKFTKVSNSKVDCTLQEFYGKNMDIASDGVGNSYTNRAYPKSIPVEVRTDFTPPSYVNIIDEMEAGWVLDSGSSLAYDTTKFISGFKSAKVIVTANNDATISKVGAWSFPDKAQFAVLLSQYHDNITGIGNPVLTLEAPDAANQIAYRHRSSSRIFYHACYSSRYTEDWEVIDFNMGGATITGNPDLRNVQKIILSVPNYEGGNRLFFDKLFWNPPMFPRGLVTIVEDDGYADLLSILKPRMDAYGYKGVVAINGNNVGVGDKLTLEQLQYLRSSGWEIANHAYKHENSYSQPQSVIEDGIRKNQDYIVNLGLGKGDVWIGTNEMTVDWSSYPIVSKYTRLSRARALAAGQYSLNNFPSFSVHSLVSVGFTSHVTEALDMLQVAADYGLWLHVYLHEATAHTTEIDNFLAKINSLGVKVVTHEDVLRILEQKQVYSQYSDLFMDVLAVSAIHIRSNEDLSAATPITFTIDAQPDVPRTLSGHFDAHANITAYTIEITGVDAKGNTVTETKTEADGWDWETSNAFATITSIKMTERTGTGVGDTMDIGITDVLGLSNVIYETGDVYKIKKNNANATVAGAQVDTDYDTYDMSVIGLANTDDFTVYYRSNLNIIN